MFRHARPVLALLAIVGLVAAGCGGSSSTPTPTPITDPTELITQSLNNAVAAKSFHLRADVSGKINLAALGDAGSALGALGGSIDLAGTNLQGDVDITKQAADLKFGLPGLLGLTGELIAVDGYSYIKYSLGGDKFTKSKLSDTLPVSIESPAASGSGGISSQVDQLRQNLQDAGMTATMKSGEKVENKDCYHVSLSIPIDKLNSYLSQSSGSTAGMTIDAATLDYWVYKDNNLPAKLHLTGSSASLGNLDVVLTFTNYNAAVSVKAPDPSQINQ